MFCHSKISKLKDLQVAERDDIVVSDSGDAREDAKISTKEETRVLHNVGSLISSVSTLAIGAAAALVATPNEALAQCVEDTSAASHLKVYNCSGTVSGQPVLTHTFPAPPPPPPPPPTGPPPPGPPPPPAPASPPPGSFTVNLSANFVLTHAAGTAAATAGLSVVTNAPISVLQSVNAGTISAYGNAIDIESVNLPAGSPSAARVPGNIVVNLTGNIVSKNAKGIYIENKSGSGASGSVSISAVNVTGKTDAISVVDQIGDGVSVTVSGAVVGTDNSGITISNSGSGDGAVSITVLDGGSITAGTRGVSVTNSSPGSQISIRSSGSITGSGGHGIDVTSVGGKTVTTVSGTETVTQVVGGIRVDVTGGSLISGGMKGINAEITTDQTGASLVGDISISAIAVTGGNSSAIFVNNEGAGNISITTTRSVNTSSAATTANAIEAKINGGTLNINADGAVNGHNTGVYVASTATNTGTLTIDVSGAVTGQSAHGVQLMHLGAGNVSIITQSTVSGAKRGIHVKTSGSFEDQTVTIDAKGKITATDEYGLSVQHDNLSGSVLTISATDISSKKSGIYVRGRGLGNINISATGLVESTEALPPPPPPPPPAPPNTPPSNPPPPPSVDAKMYHGIRVLTDQATVSGDIIITADEVKSKIGDGINVNVMLPSDALAGTTSVAGAINITVNSADAQMHGVFAKNIGTKGISVTSSGSIKGKTKEGIRVEDTGTGNIVVNAASVESEMTGAIHANNMGGGSVTVNTSGTIQATASGKQGIQVVNDASGTDIVVGARTVTAHSHAIHAVNSGGGSVTITTISGSSIVSRAAQAIRAINNGSGNLTVNLAGVVTGTDGEGMFLRNLNGGDIIVTASSGTVTGTEDLTDEVVDTIDGIKVFNDDSGGRVSLTLSSVTGAANGIVVNNEGESHINLTVSGAITAGNGDGVLVDNKNGGAVNVITLGNITASKIGINATNDENGTVISVSASSIRASTHGISVQNSGVGNISVTLTGLITSASGHGITAVSETSGLLGITGTTGGVITATEGHGIYAKNSDGSSINIDVKGAITSVSESGNRNGVLVINEVSGVNANVTVGAVTANSTAIHVTNSGTGRLSLTATGAITNTSGDGIMAVQAGNGIMTVTTSTVTSSGRGVVLTNSGTQGLVMTSSGAIEAANGFGVYVRERGIGSATINVSSVNAASGTAVAIQNFGGGSLTFSATGNITASGANTHGVSLTNDSASLDIIANVAGVTGLDKGIHISNSGTGGVSVTASGSIQANSTVVTSGAVLNSGGTGIFIQNSGGGNVSITTAGVRGTKTGIEASTGGQGNITVSASDRVTGASGEGIKLSGSANTGEISVNTRAVTGTTHGIWVKGISDGNVSVTTSGDVTGTSNDGIYLYTGQRGGNITANINRDNVESGTTNITGSSTGLFARSRGSGTINITLTGVDVSATHADAPSIKAIGEGSGNVNINIIRNVFEPAGQPTVTSSANVHGGSGGVAIETGTVSGTTNIVLSTGATVGTASGTAITNNSGNSVITLNAGATINGNVELGAGVDVFNFAGGTLNGILDGGTDSLPPPPSPPPPGTPPPPPPPPGTPPPPPPPSPPPQPIDIINFSTGTTNLVASNFRNWERVTLSSGATMTVVGLQRLEAELVNSGTIDFQNGRTGDEISVDGNWVGNSGSIVSIDVDFVNNRADRITIDGNATGTTMIEVIDVSPAGSGASLRDIRIVGISGTAQRNAFAIVDGTVLAQGSVAYRLGYKESTSGRDFVLEVSDETILDYQATLIATPIAMFDAYGRAPSFVQRRAGRLPWVEGGGIGNRVWSRTSYNGHKYGIIANKNGEYESANRSMQFGMDLYRQDFSTGAWTIGFTGQIGDLNVDSTAAGGTGTIDSESFGVGGTATWIANDNSYVDVQVQYNIVEAKMSIVRTGLINNAIESRAWFVSAEVGRQVDYSEGLIVHPQAQLTLSQVEGDDFRDRNGLLALSFDNNTAVTARVGVAAEFKATSGKGYVTANLFYDSLDRWEGTADGVRVSDSTNPMKFEVGLGSALSISRNVDFFVQGSYRLGVGSGGDEEQSTFMSTGFQVSW